MECAKTISETKVSGRFRDTEWPVIDLTDPDVEDR